MGTKKIEKSIFQEFITEQIEKWEKIRSKKFQKEDAHIPVITVSSDPGSDGSIVARKIAERLGFDLFHREIIKEIAESVDISPEVVERIEKERMSGVEDFLSSLLRDQYLWPGLYLEHLKKVIETIGRHGRAVIVGRGANFILADEDRLSLRVVAPFDLRVKNVAHRFGVSIKEARERVVNRESKRRDFLKKSFQADVADPLHYDFVINTGRVSVEDAVDAISFLWGKKYLLTAPEK
jgi:cytidylate kinase